MSTLSQFWRKQRHRWYRRGIDKDHRLRRQLAYHVAKDGFEIGDYSYGAPIIRTWGEGSRLIVGRYSSIAADVEFILGGLHRVENVTTYPMSDILGEAPDADRTWSRGDIVIGSDVWIGAGATILSGITVGDGAVIGARAVVTHDVAPYDIVAGNPARFIRKRFAEPIVTQLLDLRWWELSKEQLRPLLPLLNSDRIESFIEECRKRRQARDADIVMPTKAGIPYSATSPQSRAT